MSERPFEPALLEVLRESQRSGFLGDRDVVDAAQHARAFVAGLDGVSGRVIDIGAGGGLPGLVIAGDRPDLELLLVDRRGKRVDFLRRVIRRLGWTDRVTAREADVRDVVAASGSSHDAVVARGFGPPAVTIDLASRLVIVGGRVIISEPPTGERWGVDVEIPTLLVPVPHADRRVAVFERRP